MSADPTRLELAVLAATLTTGRIKSAATGLGLSEQAAKNHLMDLYAKIGAGSIAEAGVRLGWTKVPDDLRVVPSPTHCGWRGYCSRWKGHTGQHGGFRAI